MSVTSGFFNSLNGDRTYSAEQFSALFDNLITDGVFANVGTAFEVKANGENNITVGIGRAWFNSIWLYNDALLPMVAQDPEVLLNRIDAIVIEVNHNEAVRQASIRWVYGSPSSSPVRPTLTNTDAVHQYPLAYVYRKAGDSTVIQADITNMIGTSACPYVTGILATQDIDKVVAQWESQFYTWFDGLEASLSGDVAANLANQVLDLQSRFQTLAREKAVYEELQDSTGATIQDSNGNDILARTVLGGETVIINYPVGGGDQSEIESFKVGDTLTTMRTDLGEKWALCNGEIVSRDEYSELSSVVSPSPSGTWTVGGQSYSNAIISNQAYFTSEIVHVGGYYYLATITTGSGYQYAIGLFRSSDLETWTLLSRFNPNNGSYVSHIKMIYQNGRIVIAWAGTGNGVSIRYSSDPNADLSTWSSASISTINIELLGDLKYLAGYFVVLCSDEDGDLYLFYSQNLTNWTKVNITTDDPTHMPLAVNYINGYYICFSFKYSSGSMGNIHYWITSNISSFGSRHTLGAAAENTTVETKSFDDTLMIIITSVTPSGESQNGAYIYSVENLSTFPSGAKLANLDPTDELIMDTNPKIIIEKLDANYLVYSSIPNQSNFLLAYFLDVSSISSVAMDTSSNAQNSHPIGIAKVNDYYKLSYVSNSGFGFNKLDISKITLPSISVDEVTHTYIKVKE